MLYGAGGAILTRVGAGALQGLVPAGLIPGGLGIPLTQAAVAVVPVRWLIKKFMGQAAGDIAMLGGLISAGLALADTYLPGFQTGLSSIIRAPVAMAPGLSPAAANIVAQGAANGAAEAMAGLGRYSDVEEVPLGIWQGQQQDSFLSGLGDVEEVPLGIWPGSEEGNFL